MQHQRLQFTTTLTNSMDKRENEGFREKKTIIEIMIEVGIETETEEIGTATETATETGIATGTIEEETIVIETVIEIVIVTAIVIGTEDLDGTRKIVNPTYSYSARTHFFNIFKS